MNFNKLLALFCGVASTSIFASYFANYYGKLESFSSLTQLSIVIISGLGALAFIAFLFLKMKTLFTKNYIYMFLLNLKPTACL